MKYTAIIPGAGNSSRFHKDKLLIKLNNELLIKHTVYNFQYDKDCEKIILLVPSNKFNFYKQLFRLVNKLIVIIGGSTRSESVNLGLKHAAKSQYVLIHDAARPYLSIDLLNRIKEGLSSANIVVPYVDIFDSLIHFESNSEFSYVNRNSYKLIQTPQAFKTELLLNSFEFLKNSNLLFTDEVSLVHHFNSNEIINFIYGDLRNKKITEPNDVSEIEYDS